MKIGLISDTHGFLDQKVKDYFTDCDEIWHAGDVGPGGLLKELQPIARLRAVYGNIDETALRKELPEDNFFQIEDLKILITHIAGSPPKYNPRVRKLLLQQPVDVLVCGHSHILKVTRDPGLNLIYINPGAAGVHGFHKMKTIMTFEISENKIQEMKVIELGRRGQIS